MFTAYTKHIHTVLFTITLPSILTLLFIYASFTQCDIFSQWLHNWLYNNVYSISSTYTYGIVYNYTTQYTGFAVYICFLYTIWHFFTITAQFTLQQCLQHILNIYIRYCLQLHYPVYWLCCLYMLPLHNLTFFHNHCTIDSTTMSTAYPQHIHIVLFATTPHSILALLFIYAFLFTMWYFSTMTAQLTLQQCLQHILNIYIQYCSQLHYPVYWLYCLDMLSFSQCDIFPQWLHNSLYNNVYSISSTYTYGIVYNYTTQYTGFAVYICFPFYNVIFFQNYCKIHSTTMFTAYPQHIHAVLFTITLPSMLTFLFTYAFLFTMWIFFHTLLYNCLYDNVYIQSSLFTWCTVYNYSRQYTISAVYICCPFHNVIFFHNYCTIDSTTMSTAYPQRIHIVLFATTPHSLLALLFIYAFLFTMWYFSTMTAQFTLQQCLQHILNIYIQYCSQLHYPVYWLYCLDMLSFSQCDIFPQWLHNSLYNNVYSIY